jgi:hypothetical protein
MIEDVNLVVGSLRHILEREGAKKEISILADAEVSIEYSTSDNIGQGYDYYEMELGLAPSKYAAIVPNLENHERNILSCLNQLFRSGSPEQFIAVRIAPHQKLELTASQLALIDRNELLQSLRDQKALLISVATGGPRIDSVNAEYKERRRYIRAELAKVGLSDPVSFDDLWKWYGYWSSELGGYAPRRLYISGLLDSLIDALEYAPSDSSTVVAEPEPTGWERVDRTAQRVRQQFSVARTEEEFQTIGLLCRENLITLGQIVYNHKRHGPDSSNEPSPSDSKQRLDLYFGFELSGGANEEMRRFAKAANVLANALTHNRTATRKQAGMCATATNAVINIARVITQDLGDSEAV